MLTDEDIGPVSGSAEGSDICYIKTNITHLVGNSQSEVLDIWLHLRLHPCVSLILSLCSTVVFHSNTCQPRGFNAALIHLRIRMNWSSINELMDTFWDLKSCMKQDMLCCAPILRDKPAQHIHPQLSPGSFAKVRPKPLGKLPKHFGLSSKDILGTESTGNYKIGRYSVSQLVDILHKHSSSVIVGVFC